MRHYLQFSFTFDLVTLEASTNLRVLLRVSRTVQSKRGEADLKGINIVLK